MWNIWGLEVLRAWLGADGDRELELRKQVDYATRRAKAAAHDRDEAERQRSVAAAEVPPHVLRTPPPSPKPPNSPPKPKCREGVLPPRSHSSTRPHASAWKRQ